MKCKIMQPFSRIRRFLAAEDGPTAVEYATTLSLIAIVCLTAILTTGTRANSVFSKIDNSIPSGQQQTTTGPTRPGPTAP